MVIRLIWCSMKGSINKVARNEGLQLWPDMDAVRGVDALGATLAVLSEGR
jgi:hypothetical protein